MVRGSLAALALLTLSGEAAAQDAVFLLPTQFQTPTRTSVSVALTRSSSFPDLGAAPEPAPESLWEISGLMQIGGDGLQSASIRWLGLEEGAAWYLYRPGRRGWASLHATLAPTDHRLTAAEAGAFLSELTLTDEERASFPAPRANEGLDIVRMEFAKSFVCIARCEKGPGRTAEIYGAALEFIALPNAGPRDFALRMKTRGGSSPAPNTRVAIVAGGQPLEARADAQGAFVLPEIVHGPVLLTAEVARPPSEENGPFVAAVATLTLVAP